MSDSILQALMQLFAIVANTDEVGVGGREIVERFLRRQISNVFVERYLTVYDAFLDKLSGKTEEGKTRKRTSVNSVKVLRICHEINKELDQKQKIVVFVRLVEFVNIATVSITEQHIEFLNTVAETFTISYIDRDNCYTLVKGASSVLRAQEEYFLFIDRVHQPAGAKNHIHRDGINGEIIFLSITDPNIYLFLYTGTDQLLLDGRAILPQSVHVFETGSVIRSSKSNPIYYNDIVHKFMGFDLAEELVFDVKNLTYKFDDAKFGLHPLNFSTSSKNMVGIMGNSGAGKTTLLNLLNGTLTPSSGEILVNGVNLVAGSKKTTGLIGNIPQDDLLIEDLTVFENLFYSSKLYFGNDTDEEITQKVNECLKSLQLFEIRDLPVGDALNKFISGGQRKRLNIALELIREPEILFVDEPTSGLSSNDAENVMDLLKLLTLSGKLIFVVIHQPSSEIFKLFDQLLILDKGGYPIYFGNPLDSVRYFKKQMNFVDYESSECPECGNINPEEIFRIVEARTVDEFGKSTGNRKMEPDEWAELYNEHFGSSNDTSESDGGTQHKFKHVTLSSRIGQFLVYFKRNFFAKLNNKQYLAITLSEGPVLALVLSIALRSHPHDQPYSFGANPNIPVYIFICTIVALFLGLISSAEEIISDKKILKRESFLRLSRSSYLISKVSYLFLVSALQAGTFFSVSYFILGFPGLFWQYFLVLFSVACFGNMLGLNISSGLKTRVAVYILIPFLIIPQIMLSGVMVKFDDLNPLEKIPMFSTTHSKVPFIGNMMASRWAYEGLATYQYCNNEYEQPLFYAHCQKSEARFIEDWCAKMSDQLDSMIFWSKNAAANTEKINNTRELIQKEMGQMVAQYPKVTISGITQKLSNPSEFAANAANIKKDIEVIRKYSFELGEHANAQKNKVMRKFENSHRDVDEWKKQHQNERLEDFVKSNDQNIIECDRIIRKDQPIFIGANCASAPFFVHSKKLFGITLDTIWFNVIVIWMMTLGLYATLYFDLLGKWLSRKHR